MNNIDEIILDYNSGMSFKRLSEKYKISSTTLYHYFKENNLISATRKVKRYKNYDCEPYITYKRLYIVNEMSIAKIAEKCSCSISKVQKYLEKEHLTRTNKISKELRSSQNYKNADYFEKINNSDKAYWLGFLMADGSIDKKGYTCTLSLSAQDKEHLQKFGDIWELKVRLDDRFDNRTEHIYHSATVNICNKKIVEDLINLGMSNNKTYRLNANVFLNIDDNFKKDFIRGYFDGDGSAVGNKVSFASCSKDFLITIGDYLTKILNIDEYYIYQNNNCYVIAWYKNFNLIKIYKWLYKENCTCLYRKYLEMKKFSNQKITWSKDEEVLLSSITRNKIKDKEYIRRLFPNRTYDAIYRKYRRLIC